LAGLQSLCHDDYGPQLNSLAFVLVVLSGSILFLRVFLERRQRCRLWRDDDLLILAWVRISQPRGRGRPGAAGRKLTGKVHDCCGGGVDFLFWYTSAPAGTVVLEIPFENIVRLVPLGNLNAFQFLTILGSAWSTTSFASLSCVRPLVVFDTVGPYVLRER